MFKETPIEIDETIDFRCSKKKNHTWRHKANVEIVMLMEIDVLYEAYKGTLGLETMMETKVDWIVQDVSL